MKKRGHLRDLYNEMGGRIPASAGYFSATAAHCFWVSDQKGYAEMTVWRIGPGLIIVLSLVSGACSRRSTPPDMNVSAPDTAAALRLKSVVHHLQNKDAGYPTDARRTIAGLGTNDVSRVELWGANFDDVLPVPPGQPSIREPKNIDLGPITSNNPKVIKAFLTALENETSYRLRYGGPPNYLVLILKSPKGKPGKELDFCVQPRDPAYNGPVMQEALDVLSEHLAGKARKTARALHGQVERVSIHIHNPYAWAIIVDDRAGVEEVLSDLENVGPESYDFSRRSQLVFIRFFCHGKRHKVLRLRVPIFDDQAQLYPVYSPDMDSPPLPSRLWKRMLASFKWPDN
jgi:hypothetical protein